MEHVAVDVVKGQLFAAFEMVAATKQQSPWSQETRIRDLIDDCSFFRLRLLQLSLSPESDCLPELLQHFPPGVDGS